MSTPLLTTKLSVPPLRTKLVYRKNLIAQLNQGVENGFVLISAPAGYGKTTLLSSWLNQITNECAWLTLEPSDNDLTRFLHYLAASLSKIELSYGEVLRNSLRINPNLEIDPILIPLINQMEQSKKTQHLVLDDYHVIQDQTVHQVIAYLLDHRPSSFRLLIATRTDPPLPLNRFRAHSQVFELRLAELRFSSLETEEFLTSILGLNISKEDQAVLETNTEGWVAGLQMIGLSLQNRSDIPSYLRSFSGGNRYSLDFLFDEIFQSQTSDIQEFLMKTSILDRITGPLCDHILLRQNSKTCLDFL